MSKIKATPRFTQQVTDKQISPPVRCFCCQDSGLVSNIYLGELVEFPDRGDLLPYICQRENCDRGQAYLRAYNMSDQERDNYYNTQLRNGKDTDGLPRPMRSRDYQSNFSTNLNEACCDWLHDRSYQDWVDRIITQPKIAIAEQFTQEVADRDRTYQEIEAEIAKLQIDITPNLEKFLNHCRDRDGKEYLSIKSLPTADYKVLLQKIKGISS